jgi:hypothetical protein
LPEAWKLIKEAIKDNKKMFGANGFYCIDAKQKKAIKMKFIDVIAGVGRFMHIDILKRVVQKGDLFPEQTNCGLDTASQQRIYDYTGQSVFIVEKLSDCIIDIKGNDNINDFDMYEFSELSSKADYNEVVKKFSL